MKPQSDIITKKVEKTVISEEKFYQLNLPKAHAQTLFDVLSRVGGNSRDTRRGLIDEIIEVIEELGISFPKTFAETETPRNHLGVATDIEGNITFREIAPW